MPKRIHSKESLAHDGYTIPRYCVHPASEYRFRVHQRCMFDGNVEELEVWEG